jgi:predicted ester cyclase
VASTDQTAATASVAESYFTAVGSRDLEAMIAHWEPGGVGEIHGLVELTAPDEYGAWFGNLFEAVPDFKLEILEIVASGEKAAVRWHATGVFDGSAKFEGLAPNGSRVDIGGCDVIAVRDGKLQRNDAYLNGAEMARQLGALPPAGSFPEKALTGAVNMKTHLLSWLAARRA